MPISYKIIQVYYDDDSRANCYEHPNVQKFYNAIHTDFFENTIISNLQNQALRYDFFGVWSHLHKFKIQGKALALERLEAMMHRLDLIAFHRMMRNGRIFSGDKQKKYTEMFNNIMEILNLKYRFPAMPKFVVMNNHFICKGAIFKDYVDKVLDPAIRLIEKMPEANETIDYNGKAAYYTFKPFLCEKLISAYLHQNNYVCEHW